MTVPVVTIGAIGGYQVNVAALKGGAVPVTIQIEGVISNTVTIAV